MPHYVLGEMFSGPGGIALGAELASRDAIKEGRCSTVRHGWAVEYHPDTAETYRKNIHGATDETVFTADVRGFDLRKVPAFDAFAFGFPCNDFSTVGEHRGLEGDYGALYTYGVHALALRRPEWFLAENVSGLSRANGGRAFGKILSALRRPGAAALTDPSFTSYYGPDAEEVDEDLEYELVAHLYKFEKYGVPQRRHRILIVGIRRDVRESLPRGFRVPLPTTPAKWQQRTARDVLENEPIDPSAYNNVPIKHRRSVVERLKAIQPGKNAFNTTFDDDSLVLNVKGATLSNIYRKLDPDEPSYTVTGSGGGGTHMYHWNEPRALTNRERARLQTFPDSFRFYGSQPSVRRQVGMAVPPEGAQVVIDAILKTMDGETYEAETRPSIDVGRLIRAYEAEEADGMLASRADDQLEIPLEQQGPDRTRVRAGPGGSIIRGRQAVHATLDEPNSLTGSRSG
ncbi:cytosine methyltransferase [Brachybacterium phenoliresistens]|uniref:DNA (cytosine-5-)-methyltransferase n=1 Tax=Brachybacterium phenoliresistens TaxID=396014 RepID=Z9JWZ2_9MICO|nr:DNA cytosine methyltransferase [Brachybacterium phenoliresistens]EWS82321.1 cytosine methyltransferase [Brachybacterium phenoliresistens]